MPGEGRYLALDERMVVRIRRHPAVLSITVLQSLGAVFVALLISSWISAGVGAVDTVLGVIILAALGRLGWRLWEWSVDRIVVTDRRILEVSGLLSRKVASMPLDKVTDMTYRRTVTGRVLGYGAFIVESPGQKQAVEMINFIPQPDDFYQTVTSLVMTGPEMEDHLPVPVGDDDDDDTGPLPRVIVLGDDS
jgi:ABC-type transport system involved in cytochrome c biogenesis permease subunit